MGWLSGWDKRIKLTVDHSKIDADLSHFPVTVILSSTHGDCVFDELISDANRLKIAFTKSDGTTQMYGEIEKWDDANESAIIHVSLSGWSISSSVDTDFYMYYDSGHVDNTSYIGDIDSTPGHSVWDSNFKLVCHMVDATTSTVKDSTSNGNDGTKRAANEPVEATGKVGKGQDFDGTDDKITNGSISLTGANLSYEAIVKVDAFQAAWPYISSLLGIEVNDTNSALVRFGDAELLAKEKTQFVISNGTTQVKLNSATTLSTATWYYIVCTYNSIDMKIYINGTENATQGQATSLVASGDFWIGANNVGGRYLNGMIDEVRISISARPAAWIKATYNTLWDTLLTYGSEETPVTFIPRVIIFKETLMKAIKLYRLDGSLYFEGTCEITEIKDVIIEPVPPEEIEEPEEKIYLKDWVTPPEPISIKKSIQTKLPYYVYAGQPSNRYLWKEYADILDLILMSLFKTFSSMRECKFTGVYDACGSGSGHPGGSHKFSDVNGRAVDLSYWTLTGDCFTQRWNIPKEYSLNQLWKTDNIDTHFVSHFDWERLYYFAVRLKEVLPNARITVDQRIKDFLLQRVRYVYGKEEEAKVKFIHRDAPKNYNHHQHIHIDLDAYRKNINWEADISHWWRLKND